MGYRCSDKVFLKGMKDYIYQYDNTPDDTWTFLYKYLYIDDLYTYSTQVFAGKTVERGVGNLNSKVVLVIDSMTNIELIKTLKDIFSKINVDYNKLYVTSFYKAVGANDNQCDDILTRELKGIKPELIFQFGDHYAYSNPQGYDISPIPTDVMDNIMKPADDATLKANKKKLWVIIREMIKHL